MAGAERPPETASRASTILPLAGLALLLFILTARQIYDLDHGFYVAVGREILARGIPQTEWYLPELADRPFASPWLLSAPMFAAAWDWLGPAGLVALKVACYGGGFMFAAMAAVRRGARPWVAAMVAGVFAAAVSTRFVERPGMFSALLMGVVVACDAWNRKASGSSFFKSSSCQERERQSHPPHRGSGEILLAPDFSPGNGAEKDRTPEGVPPAESDASVGPLPGSESPSRHAPGLKSGARVIASLPGRLERPLSDSREADSAGESSRATWRFAIPGIALFAIWSFLHAEWFLGVGVATVLLWRAERGRVAPVTAWVTAWLLVPAGLFALIHPAGVRALLSPFGFLTGGSGISVQEYSGAGWSTMPGAVFVLVAMVFGGGLHLRARRWDSAILLFGFLVLSLGIRRAILPAAIVAVPLVAPLLPDFRGRPRQWGPVLGFLVAAAAVGGQYAISPWFRAGFTLDETLDTRGIGAVLDRLPGRSGTVLAEFGWSSLLLSNPGVVRHGVLMDGRQEAYPPDYFASVYTPCFRPGPGWEEALTRADIAFYVEPQRIRSGADDFVPAFQAAGWRLVAWDNSSRLVVRDDVAERYDLAPLAVDPSHLEKWVKASPKELETALAEVRARTEALEAAGFPSTIGRLALAKLELYRDNTEAAEAELKRAPTGKRFASYREIQSRVLLMQGHLEEAVK